MDRRQLLTGLVSFVAAPAIVRVTSIMPVKLMPDTILFDREEWVARVMADYMDQLLLEGRAEVLMPYPGGIVTASP